MIGVEAQTHSETMGDSKQTSETHNQSNVCSASCCPSEAAVWQDRKVAKKAFFARPPILPCAVSTPPSVASFCSSSPASSSSSSQAPRRFKSRSMISGLRLQSLPNKKDGMQNAPCPFIQLLFQSSAARLPVTEQCLLLLALATEASHPFSILLTPYQQISILGRWQVYEDVNLVMSLQKAQRAR